MDTRKARAAFAAFAVALAAFAAVAAPKKNQYDIKPDAAKAKAPTAVQWSLKNDAAIAAATEEDVLAAAVADAESAAALLAKVRPAYATDPVEATKIAAVTQWTMQEDPCFLFFWKPSPSDGRKVWTEALLDRAEKASDGYVKTFCLDQLRWCAPNCPLVKKRVAAIGAGAKDRAVKDMADMVAAELSLR